MEKLKEFAREWGLQILFIVALFAAAFWIAGCQSEPHPSRDAERSRAIVAEVEKYAAGRESAEDLLIFVLRQYNESLRDRPDPGGDIWEMVGLAIGAAVPAAAGGVALLNKRRNATRAAELAERDDAMAGLQKAIERLEAKGGAT